MGILRKTLYTFIGLPAAAIVAESFYTQKCVQVDPPGRLPRNSALAAKRESENKIRYERYERVVPLKTLVDTIGPVDSLSLSRRMAKQIWLTRTFAPQRALCEQILKSHKAPGANLTVEELEREKIKLGFDVSQHLAIGAIDGSYIQFDPVPYDMDFLGPGGVVTVDVERRGDDVVFGMECGSIGLPTHGSMGPVDALQYYLHKVYARLLLEEGVKRILYGKGE